MTADTPLPVYQTALRVAGLGVLAVALAGVVRAQNFNELDAPSSRAGIPTLAGEGLDTLMARQSMAAGNDPFYDIGNEMKGLFPGGWQRPNPNLSVFQGFPSLTPANFGAYPGGQFPVPFQTDIQLAPTPMQWRMSEKN